MSSAPISFQGSILFISLRSPFARRVRVALFEHGISFQERVCDVFHPTAELIAVNPLARVPILQLSSGQILIDSHLILQCLYENIESPLGPLQGSDRVEFLRWSALAVGLAEKVVEYFLETQRPTEKQDPEITLELVAVRDRVLQALEAVLSRKGQDYLVGNALSQADLDIGVALAYLNLRHTDQWKVKYPQTRDFLQRLEERPSFQQTLPPQV